VASIDTILLHRGAEPELSHKLAYVGSTRTDVVAWKSDHTATEARSDLELWHYCGLDCVVDARVAPELLQEVKDRKMTECVRLDHKIQAICADLHINGMLVNQKLRVEYDARYKTWAQSKRERCRLLAGRPTMNPNSVPQIVDLLFTTWGLPYINVSEKSGEPSTGDETIRFLLGEPGVTPDQRQFIEELRWFRRYSKFRGTYITKLRRMDEPIPRDDLAYDEEEDEDDKDDRKHGRKKVVKLYLGIVHPDGRMRADYSAHGTTSRRLSSSHPNNQNYPRKIRDIILPKPGFIYVYADMDQLELRAAANLAGAKAYIEAFNSGGDPHTTTLLAIFAERGAAALAAAKAWAKETGKKYKEHPPFSLMRDFAKRFSYACLYSATPETVWDVIQSAEDDEGNLVYRDVTVAQARDRRRNWLDANPEIEQWWASTVAEYRRQRFLAEPVEGWRRDFLDGEEICELVNFKPQSLGAALVHRATIGLSYGADAPLRRGVFGPSSGLVQQGHDALVYEVPREKASWACNLVTEAMTQKIAGHPVKYTAEAKVYLDWKNPSCNAHDDKGRICVAPKPLKKDDPHTHEFY
jgi:hypothetical protein